MANTFKFKVACADCGVKYEQIIQSHEFKPEICGCCGSDWIAVKQIDGEPNDGLEPRNLKCARCGCLLDDIQFCTNAACVFSSHLPHCDNGWWGHPLKEKDAIANCQCQYGKER